MDPDDEFKSMCVTESSSQSGRSSLGLTTGGSVEPDWSISCCCLRFSSRMRSAIFLPCLSLRSWYETYPRRAVVEFVDVFVELMTMLLFSQSPLQRTYSSNKFCRIFLSQYGGVYWTILKGIPKVKHVHRIYIDLGWETPMGSLGCLNDFFGALATSEGFRLNVFFLIRSRIHSIYYMQLKCFEEICKSACIPSSVQISRNHHDQVPFQLQQLLQPRSGINIV